jgi:hypothetical protein
VTAGVPDDAATAPVQSPADPNPVIRNDQAILDAGLALAEGTDVTEPSVTAFPVPAGGGVAIVDRNTDEHRRKAGLHPLRSVADTTVVNDEQGLIALVDRWPHPDKVVVYADAIKRTVVAVLDYDHDAAGGDSGGDVFGWRKRRVQIALVHTPEWEAWAAFDRKMVPQATFAEFIDEHLEDVRHPSAADMLEIAQSLEATTGVQFRQATRLQDGQRQFTYNEDTNASAGPGGQLVIPDEFTIALTPWQGRAEAPFEVRARLRYRIASTGLAMGYVLMDVDRILRAAFRDDVVAPIRAAGLTVVNGTP